jgi:uncharacterized protein YyaL (SSP411 family)
VVDPTLTGAEKPRLAAALAKMRAARHRRVRPHRDDKILASWNGLMLGALARAYAVLGEEDYRVAAERNLAFLQRNLWQPAETTGGERPGLGTLHHRWRDGERDSVQLLEAYACLLAGVVELYEATVEPAHLEFGVALAVSMVARFYDPVDGGFWQSPAGAKDLILRVKEDYDGAEPSGNSVAVLALLKLGALTGRDEFTAAARRSLGWLSGRLREAPQAVPHLLLGLDFSLQEPRRVVVAGPPAESKTRDLLRAIHSVYQPNKVVLGTTGPVEEFARSLPKEGDPAVYVCLGTACQAPTGDRARVKELLR